VTYYITTPIYYANGEPTIGHVYTTIAADTIARYQRLQGQDTFLVTGTDEHGVNIERIATQRGTTPRAHVDQIAASFQRLFPRLDVTYDGFVRTSSERHKRAALELWRRLQASGDLYRGTYEGDYCPRCEAYYAQADLLEGTLCPVHGLPTERVAEENWFFRLSRYQTELERLVGQTELVQPAFRRNEVLAQLRDGLSDFSASRKQVKWGIPVPENPDEVIYVWVEALASYLTGVGFPDAPATFERYWPAAAHLIGKEIIRFHCLYWPALLLSAGLPLPKRVYAHGWLTREGQKISKTTGNSIDPTALVDEFGPDAVRYYFVRAIPFGQDGDFSYQAFVERYNADLANDFGNLVQRATKLAVANAGAPIKAEPGGPERSLRDSAHRLETQVGRAYERFALHDAAAAVGEFVRDANRYLDATTPWFLARDGDPRLGLVLDHALEAARLAAWYYAPIIPRGSTEAYCRIVGTPPLAGQGRFGRVAHRDDIQVGAPIFPRIASR
jgi:methionyl-tRNA synthetase